MPSSETEVLHVLVLIFYDTPQHAPVVPLFHAPIASCAPEVCFLGRRRETDYGGRRTGAHAQNVASTALVQY